MDTLDTKIIKILEQANLDTLGYESLFLIRNKLKALFKQEMISLVGEMESKNINLSSHDSYQDSVTKDKVLAEILTKIEKL